MGELTLINGGMLMIDITMSYDYRKFLEEQNYKFTDFQTATLV